MTEQSPKPRSAEVLDYDFVVPFDEKAQHRVDLLVQTALGYREQNDYEGAKSKLKEAALVIGGKDDEREAMVLAFLKELGGDDEIWEVTGRDIERVQKELIRIQEHSFNIKRDFARPGENEAAARGRFDSYIAWLKRRNGELIERKATLKRPNSIS